MLVWSWSLWVVLLSKSGSGIGAVFVGELPDFWARFYSLVRLIPFVATSSGVEPLSSKRSMFLAVHIVRRVQGRIKFAMPVGGRQIAYLNLTIIDVFVSSITVGTACRKGTKFQTFLAKGHSKKMCIDVSGSLHLGQLRSDVMPLVCRFSPVGSALWMMDQGKTWGLGDNFPDHMSFTQWKYWLSGWWLWWCLSAEAIAYPDLME